MSRELSSVEPWDDNEVSTRNCLHAKVQGQVVVCNKTTNTFDFATIINGGLSFACVGCPYMENPWT